MNEQQTDEVKGWIEECLSQKVVTIEIKRRVMDTRLRMFPLAANCDPKAVAEAILRACERDGKTQNLVDVGYLALAWRTDPPPPQSDDFANSIVIEVTGKGARKPGDTGALEGNNTAGIIAQQMRLTDNLHRMLVAKMETGDATMNRILERLEQKLERYEDRRDAELMERMKVVVMVEELASDKAAREVKQRQMVLEEKRHEWVSEQLDQTVPILMNRLMGGGPGKGAPIMGEQILMRFLASLKPDQVDKLMSGLGLEPTQLALISELYLSYGKQWEKLKNKKHVTRDDEANGAAGAAKPADKVPS